MQKRYWTSPFLANCLRFPLFSPIKFLRFLRLPLYVSQSPQYSNCPSKSSSRNLYKGRDTAFPKSSLKCLTWLLEFPVKQPSLQVLLTARYALLQDALRLYIKVLPLQVPQRSPYGKRCPFPEPSLTYLSGFPVQKPSVQDPLTEFPWTGRRSASRPLLHLSLKVLDKMGPILFLTGTPIVRVARFQIFLLNISRILQ